EPGRTRGSLRPRSRRRAGRARNQSATIRLAPSSPLFSYSPEISLHHHHHQLLEVHGRLPPELHLGPGGVAPQSRHLGRPGELLIDPDVVPPLEPDVRERHATELADRAGAAGRDHVFPRLAGLAHEPPTLALL